MPKIHGVNMSPFVRKTRAALAEKGIAVEVVPVFPGGGGDESFKKISPLGKIPVFEDDDGFTVPDSSVIIAYLEKTRPQPALYPSDPQDMATALFLEEYADTRLVEAVITPFRERVVNKMMGQPTNEEAIATSLREVTAPTFDYLESLLEDGTEALVGGRLSVADLAVASPFVNFSHGGETVDAERWPKLAAYVERTLGRPSFKGLIAEEQLPG